MQIIKVAHIVNIQARVFVQISDFLQEDRKALAKFIKKVYNYD